jgi:hypothetical protein
LDALSTLMSFSQMTNSSRYHMGIELTVFSFEETPCNPCSPLRQRKHA